MLVSSLPAHTVAVRCRAIVIDPVVENVHCSLWRISFHVGFGASLLGALLATSWPSFRYVSASTLNSSIHPNLTQFTFRHLRFQELQEKLLVAPSSAEIVHSNCAPALEEEEVEGCYHNVQTELSLISDRPQAVIVGSDALRVEICLRTSPWNCCRAWNLAEATCAWTLPS